MPICVPTVYLFDFSNFENEKNYQNSSLIKGNEYESENCWVNSSVRLKKKSSLLYLSENFRNMK